MGEDIERLAIELSNARNAEEEARTARIAAEEALASAVGGRPCGNTTVHVGRFAITVKRGSNYRIDTPQAFAEKFPDFVRRTEKIEIVAPKYEMQRAADSALYREMAEHVTVTPRKVSVELRI